MNRIAPLLALCCATGGLFGAAPENTEPAKTAASATPLYQSPACSAADTYFQEQVWTKVAAQHCLKCHKPGGDAEDSKFILQDPAKDPDPERRASLRHNRIAFSQMAALKAGAGRTGEADQSRLLLKSIGELDHGGDDVLKKDSAAYRILADFVHRVTGDSSTPPTAEIAAKNARPFFDGIEMMDNRRLLRRVTLSLAARLPSASEMAALEKDGFQAMGPILDAIMKEDAFYDRLAEGFEDIFLTRGYIDLPERVLDYEHFTRSREWPDKYDLNFIADEKDRRKARFQLTEDYREAIHREPMELIKYIVREERPFTELVTADYTMVSPYSARGYGVFEEIRDEFEDAANPFEYVPVRLHALKGRSRQTDQPSETGFYPHAGIMTSFQFIRRYPTTETNRNRARARVYYQLFLGIDVLELAARVSDAAAITAKFKTPTMEASECVVCHKTIDPVAGTFQDYYDLPDANYGPRKGGWFTDMFPPGFEGEHMPPEQKWRALQWLGERTAKDPRFTTTMVEHVYYVLTGRKVLLPPKALDDADYDAKLRAYQAQHKEVEAIAVQFTKANFNLKTVFKAWIASPFYRADSVAMAAADPNRRAEFGDLGLARMLAPEQLERKVAAIFPQPWGKLKNQQFAMLYGGIDSKEVTERAADPSGAMGALQRIMANDVALNNVSLDFKAEPAQRRFFKDIELGVTPGTSPDAENQIRQTIVHLHELVLGRYDTEDSAEVNRTYKLFTALLADPKAHQTHNPKTDETDATLRAWRGVMTYLLRREDFLYE